MVAFRGAKDDIYSSFDPKRVLAMAAGSEEQEGAFGAKKSLPLKTDGVPLAIRIGIGHDTHRLAPGSALRLGGVTIPHDRQLVGHSDADVLLHAVTDALLGAAAMGDIGELFPDTDQANRNRDSGEMLTAAAAKVRAAGFRVVNIDSVVFAQRPRLLAHKLRIRQRIAELLGLDVEQVGVKAKTGEMVGPVGREEAVMAQAVVLLENDDPRD